jgi:hypothetical protein
MKSFTRTDDRQFKRDNATRETQHEIEAGEGGTTISGGLFASPPYASIGRFLLILSTPTFNAPCLVKTALFAGFYVTCNFN